MKLISVLERLRYIEAGKRGYKPNGFFGDRELLLQVADIFNTPVGVKKV